MNWSATKKERELIEIICDRMIKTRMHFDQKDIAMALEATHCNGNPLDFKKLLAANDFNFSHDIIGIMQNLDSKTGKLKNCFSPRCSKVEVLK